MSRRELLTGLLVPLFWGLNFVVIRVGLDSIPPLLLSALRFGVAGAVGVWFVGRPAVSWATLGIVGLAIGVGQFGLLFVAIDLGMPAGLAGVVIQVQVLFTIVLALVFRHERPASVQSVGVVVALGGLAVLALDAAQRLVLVGFGLTILAALSWAIGNLRLRRIDTGDALGVVVWSSLVPPVPLVALAVALDGPAAVGTALTGASPAALATVAYQALFATLLAFGIWVRLLARHEAAVVTPLALLVPTVALGSAALLLDEPLTGRAIAGTFLVTIGLAIPYVSRCSGIDPARLARAARSLRR